MSSPDRQPKEAWDALDFRPRGTAPARAGRPSHFWTGVAIFIAVALVYPWYAYHVQSWLMEREAAVVLGEFARELTNETARLEGEMARAGRQASTAELQRRLATVRVLGTTTVQGQRVVIVNLGSARMHEAHSVICDQAARLYREPLAGQVLRVQSSQGQRPARDVGELAC